MTHNNLPISFLPYLRPSSSLLLAARRSLLAAKFRARARRPQRRQRANFCSVQCGLAREPELDLESAGRREAANCVSNSVTLSTTSSALQLRCSTMGRVEWHCKQPADSTMIVGLLAILMRSRPCVGQANAACPKVTHKHGADSGPKRQKAPPTSTMRPTSKRRQLRAAKRSGRKLSV